jgi:predicted NAD/FAD-binding protein
MGVGATVARHYVFPLASALWSTGIPDIRGFPARTFIDFFTGHRLFQVFGRLEWRTVEGGSRRYVDAALARMPADVATAAGVERIERSGREVVLHLADGTSTRFDRVIVATHADRALSLLADPTSAEVDALSPWRYTETDTWLHSDPSYLPDRARAQASWNYHLTDCRTPEAGPTMTYNLNRLQGLETDQPVLVTLNPGAQPRSTHLRRRYRHPMFTEASIASQDAIRALGDDTRTYFCGAHLGYGFHEDGLRSGVELGERLGGRFP